EHRAPAGTGCCSVKGSALSRPAGTQGQRGADVSAAGYYEGRDNHAGQRQRGRAPGREPAGAKPLWRGWLHLVWFELSLVLGTVLVMDIPVHERVPATVYTATVSALFGTSALYHRGNWR